MEFWLYSALGLLVVLIVVIIVKFETIEAWWALRPRPEENRARLEKLDREDPDWHWWQW